MSRPLLSFFLVTPVTAGILAVTLGVVCIAADVIAPDATPLVRAALFAGVGPAPWALVAFLVGAVAGRSGGGMITGMFWGVGSLLAADAIYYLGHVYLGTRSMSDTLVRSALVWGIVAIIAGVGFGAAGSLWANGSPSVAGIALALVASTLVVEAAYLGGRTVLETIQSGAIPPGADRGRLLFAVVEGLLGVTLVVLAPRGGRLSFAVTLAGASAMAFFLGPMLMDVTGTAIAG
ncbi:MAG: hypothetical protein GEU79_09375 [Acidimicrobiia bacterium]|nr:hypothetical protein [Acidimicrobiia bacterium]